MPQSRRTFLKRLAAVAAAVAIKPVVPNPVEDRRPLLCFTGSDGVERQTRVTGVDEDGTIHFEPTGYVYSGMVYAIVSHNHVGWDFPRAVG